MAADEPRVRSFEEAESHVRSLVVNDGLQDERLHALEDMLDIRRSPLWKRALFRLDGWGPWHTLRDTPRWRPWRRWWVS